MAKKKIAQKPRKIKVHPAQGQQQNNCSEHAKARQSNLIAAPYSCLENKERQRFAGT